MRKRNREVTMEDIIENVKPLFEEETWFFEEKEGGKNYSFGKKGDHFDLYYMGENYYILSSYSFKSEETEKREQVSQRLAHAFQKEGLDVMINGSGLHATGPRSTKMKEVFLYLCEHIDATRKKYNFILPNYDIVPRMGFFDSIYLGYQRKEIIEIDTLEDAIAFAEKENEVLVKIQHAAENLEKWIEGLESFSRILKTDYSKLYLVQEDIGIQFDFRQRRKEKAYIYEASYSVDNKRFTAEHTDLDTLLQETTVALQEKVKETLQERK